MKNLLQTGSVLTILALALYGCFGTENVNLQRKLANEESIDTREELRNRVDQHIISAPDLTEMQKKDLNELFSEGRTQADQIRVESSKLKSILIKDMLSADYDPVEGHLIKRKLSQLKASESDLGVNIMLRANKILGPLNKQHPEILTDPLRDFSGTEY